MFLFFSMTYYLLNVSMNILGVVLKFEQFFCQKLLSIYFEKVVRNFSIKFGGENIVLLNLSQHKCKQNISVQLTVLQKVNSIQYLTVRFNKSKLVIENEQH